MNTPALPTLRLVAAPETDASRKPARLVQFAREVMHIYSQDDKQAIEQAVSDFEAFCQKKHFVKNPSHFLKYKRFQCV